MFVTKFYISPWSVICKKLGSRANEFKKLRARGAWEGEKLTCMWGAWQIQLGSRHRYDLGSREQRGNFRTGAGSVRIPLQRLALLQY